MLGQINNCVFKKTIGSRLRFGRLDPYNFSLYDMNFNNITPLYI